MSDQSAAPTPKPLHPGLAWRRIVGPLVDAVIFAGVWLGVMATTNARFPWGVMQDFSQSDYDAYVLLMTRMTLALFVLSLITHFLFKASLGKLVTGLQVVRADGGTMGPLQVLVRSFAMFMIGIMILAPGPLVAFIFGKGSEGMSVLSLALGILLWLGATMAKSPQSFLERWIGIKTVRRGS